MRFSAKKDLIYAFVIWSGPFFLIPFLFFEQKIILILFVAALMLSIWIWNSTIYRIENGILNVKCWILRTQIKISEINTVKKTKNIESSYALSMERLAINFHQNTIYIAPSNFDAFIDELTKHNPNILVH